MKHASHKVRGTWSVNHVGDTLMPEMSDTLNLNPLKQTINLTKLAVSCLQQAG